ncbi:MAG: M20/M25/M40 family metallo-hydrolase [Phycisphaerales bacterium]|nr:M20/M25/M40 family metallo-hydrolase [Phycisphaerales bacterium]
MSTANRSTSAASRTRHEALALELTVIPTAAGREDRVQAFLDRWLHRRRGSLRWRRDGDGNLLITSRERSRKTPLLFTAHLDHPGFVVKEVLDARTVLAEFRGGVMDPYFDDARVECIDANDQTANGRVTRLDAAEPFKVAEIRLDRPLPDAQPGDLVRWKFPAARITGRGNRRQLHTNACDDLAAAAAALAAFDRIRKRKGMGHVGLLFTVAEEVGFVGAIGAARSGFTPANARLICLENSRASADAPIGDGPVVRVGDRLSVFDPKLTNRISELATAYASDHPGFAWQRKLMVGGACEATAFSALGHSATCLCLPLGNYHNMERIDEVRDGERPARLGREYVSVEDYHGLIELLELVADGLDGAGNDLPRRLNALRRRNAVVFDRR